MKYKLKKKFEAFEVVDGALAGRKYEHGRVYEEIPPQEKAKFEEIKPVEPPKETKPVETKTKPKSQKTGIGGR